MNNKPSIIDIYEQVLSGQRLYFPKGTWQDPENAKILIKYLFEVELEWSIEDIKKKSGTSVFKQYSLGAMLAIVYQHSPVKAVLSVYGDQILPWELGSVEKGFWNNETMAKAIRWLVEDKLKWSDDEVKKNMNMYVFYEYGLSTLMSGYLNGSTYAAMDLAYPGKFKPWEFRYLPKNTWNPSTCKEAVKWLVEDILGLTSKEAFEKVNQYTFKKHGLGPMLEYRLNNDVHQALQLAYSQ